MKFIRNTLLTLGRGIGQVMFQNNALSGLLMLVGIFLNSWQMGVLAICGNILSTLTAYCSGYNREDIKNGLYGFNGTLVGIATGVFLTPSIENFLLLATASALSTWIAYLFTKQRLLSGFTAPFILAVWGMLGVCTWLVPDLLQTSDSAHINIAQENDYLQALCLGIGQVMFQGNTILAGLFFLIGILFNSPRCALYALLGAALPIPIAAAWGIEATTLNAGLMGYNGVLCAIAIGKNSWQSGLYAACSVVLSTILQIIGMKYGITTLTAPFVISVWVVMIIPTLLRKITRM